jgi:RNA polymerase sigma-70 factor (ECF subfamily)
VRSRQQILSQTPCGQEDQTAERNHLCGEEEDLQPEQATFANSVAQHLPYLQRVVSRLTGNDPATDDVVQQTILKALVHADRFRFESTVKTWLTSIAKNELRQLYRCKWRKRAVPLSAEDLESELAGHVDPTIRTCEAHERETCIRRAVSRLPEGYRSVVELCDLQGRSLEEAAAELHLTIPAVKTRLRRARKRLQPLVAKFKP